jgi:hypothetical protein
VDLHSLREETSGAASSSSSSSTSKSPGHKSQHAAREAMSQIPGLRKGLSHTNSISGPTLPRFGIVVEKEDEVAEVRTFIWLDSYHS